MPWPGDRGPLEVLGLRSPAKGPGAMVSNLLTTLSPAFIRGLNGANRGLGGA